MAEVNKNSSLFSTFREEYIDPYPLTNFLAKGFDKLGEPTTGEKARDIRENYQTYTLDQLNNAAKALETDLSGVYDADDLLRQKFANKTKDFDLLVSDSSDDDIVDSITNC